ncbi:hypothetical protein I8752_05360 [Nostocaceae cyanobacterium CENA369]|uniref:Low temperature-induced protein n=1 Tax=Dendronalium phyllosphericum CENA369 TaxID=1725256 RepID=A0A8J7I4Q6_9NOST|nr:hypothetical protein [Dendronalium phyllosphericum]MBH8572472.1 hypothetical protein [Dendronalium phyllosphericum CENA369]
MSFIRFVQPIIRPLRFVIAAALCLTLVVSNAFPAAAIGSSKSSPTEGTTQLNEIQEKTDEVARSAPPSLEEVQSKSEKGLNEVQGDADINKMKRPDNSQNATSVIDKVEDYLGKVTGDK